MLASGCSQDDAVPVHEGGNGTQVPLVITTAGVQNAGYGDTRRNGAAHRFVYRRIFGQCHRRRHLCPGRKTCNMTAQMQRGNPKPKR